MVTEGGVGQGDVVCGRFISNHKAQGNQHMAHHTSHTKDISITNEIRRIKQQCSYGYRNGHFFFKYQKKGGHNNNAKKETVP